MFSSVVVGWNGVGNISSAISGILSSMSLVIEFKASSRFNGKSDNKF
jgi:hypothetical protein